MLHHTLSLRNKMLSSQQSDRCIWSESDFPPGGNLRPVLLEVRRSFPLLVAGHCLQVRLALSRGGRQGARAVNFSLQFRVQVLLQDAEKMLLSW